MNTKHTPEPWNVGEGPHKRNREVFDGNGFLVADCRTCCKEPETEKANARLIAAAPDMLEALRELLADPYLSDPINADRMTCARAAIAKAEGGQA